MANPGAPTADGWTKPPPSASSADKTRARLKQVGKWGKWLARGGGPVLRAVTAVMEPSPTAMPWFDEVPQDAFEQKLFSKARELDAQGVDRDDVLDWFKGERAAHANTKAEADKKAKEKTRPKAAENVRVTTKVQKKELCEIACECLKDRGGHRTYQACVAEKLRKKYYDPNSGQHPAGGPRRPMSPDADGPRPEVSYRPGPDGRYAPVESQNAPGMPSNAPVVSGAPRPDVSWWQGGGLSRLWELKFPQAGGGIDRMTNSQRSGRYSDIAKDQSQSGKDSVEANTIDVDRDCNCGRDK